MESLHNLTAGVTQLSGRLDQFYTQLNVLTAPAPAPPPPAPDIPVTHPGQPREPFIPTPVRCFEFLTTRFRVRVQIQSQDFRILAAESGHHVRLDSLHLFTHAWSLSPTGTHFHQPPHP
ncbi:hypothetical protein NQZ68_024723 [Dissostichus eleginoides]|nr:hypothetical protein NQZ68_024723 [Dissostichus eleginoides]